MDEATISPNQILDDPWDESYVNIIHPLPQFLNEGGASTYRLSQPLRDAALTMDPLLILARAAEAFFFAANRAETVLDKQAAVARGNAFADLAVTGRQSYSAFKQGLDITSLQTETRSLLSTEDPAPTDAEVTAAIDQALDRAYAVAWALRGPAAQRAALRAPLGWVAVSGEDDKPHRPVNMPAPPYEQYEVVVNSGGLQLPTRFFIASTDAEQVDPVTPSRRSAPPDPTPSVPAGHEVILFLHGHSSGAEEAVEIIPHLLKEGAERGKKYSVIAFDLPNNGYSETFDHTSIAPTEASTYPQLWNDSGPIATPILDFIENFVVAFVDAVDAITPIKNRFAAVIGGSLGGNLALRLGRRDSTNGTTTPWLRDCSIVAWSPASVWMPKVQDTLEHLAPNKCFDRCRETEGVGSRASYFSLVYKAKEAAGLIAPQPEYWYRRDWDPKPVHVSQSALARFEIYNSNYRRWHWRVAGEQLIYSRRDNEVHGDTGTAIRYELNTVRTLLVACAEDNYLGTRIYDNTITMDRAMGATKGRLLSVARTGHSIHFERPRYFAKEIVKFLAAKSMQIKCVTRRDGRIVSVSGTNVTDNVEFRMSEDECMQAIARGDEFFVMDANGNRARVVIRATNSRPYLGDPGGKNRGYHLKTVADPTTSNNLESLPDCPEI